MYFFTSDQHFGHANCIKYCARPFASVEEMDEELIKRWNTVVSKTDTVYHLGDFTLGEDAEVYLSRLHGKIKFVVPDFHHDKKWLENKPDLPNVEYFPPVITIQISNLILALCHFPMARWDRQHYGSYHLFGHCHNRFHQCNLSLDIGVDAAYNLLGEYRPFSLNEVIAIIKKKELLYAEESLDKGRG